MIIDSTEKPVFGFIYLTTNLINGKQYVGQRKYRRKPSDISYLGSGKILKLAIQKNGIESFKREIIDVCFNQIEMDELEIFHISDKNTLYPNGYNIGLGGQFGNVLEHHPNRETIIEKMKHRVIWSTGLTKEIDERLRKMSEYLKNRIVTDEHKLHNSNSQKNPETNRRKIESRRKNNKVWHSLETRQKIRDKKLGQTHTEEWKKNHSENRKGQARPEKEVERMKAFMLDPNNKISCSLCGKKLNRCNYSRHFNKCKREYETHILLA